MESARLVYIITLRIVCHLAIIYRMFAYIDDSGDSGFHFDNGSTRYVVMAACIFDSKEAITQAWKLMETARCEEQNGVFFHRYDREFKYNKTHARLKNIFFDTMADADYHVRVIIIDKTKLYSPKLLSEPKLLKSYMIRQLFTHTFGRVKNCTLYIDGQDTRAFAISDKDYLMHIVNKCCPSTLTAVNFVDSKDNPMIQLADMTAGAVRATLETNNPQALAHFNTFAKRTVPPLGNYWIFTNKKTKA